MEKTKSIFDKFKANAFYRNIVLVAGGNAIAKLIGIALIPIITRLYSPADFGIFNIFISIFGIIGSLATMRYAIAIPIVKDESTAYNLLRLCFLATLTLCLSLVFLVAVFGQQVAELYEIQYLKTYLWFIPIALLGKGVYEALNNWAIRSRSFRLITRTSISQGISSSGTKIGLGILNIKPLGLFIGQIAQEAAGIISLSSRLVKTNPTFFSTFSIIEIKRVAIRYKRFPLIQSWSQLLLATGAQLPILMLGVFYNAEVVGVFGLAKSMIHIPVDLIGQSVSQVYYAEISEFGKEKPDKIYALSVALMKKLFFMGFIPVAFLIFFGPRVFGIVFGPEWVEAGAYARFLSIYVMVVFISAPLANVFNIYERMDLQFKLNLIRVVYVALIFIVCQFLSLSALQTVTVFSVGMMFYFILLTGVILRLLKGNLAKNEVYK